MAIGEVKWFNNAKGWGFIIPDGGGEDIFVHYSSIHGTGYKTLFPGQQVNFDLVKGDRGHHATNVIALTEAPIQHQQQNQSSQQRQYQDA